MPGIDFAVLREQVPILDVFALLQIQPTGRGYRLRSPCPLQCRQSPRDCVIYVDTNRYYCHHCHCGGNQLELWAETQGLSFYDGSKDLCQHLGISIPYLYRW